MKNHYKNSKKAKRKRPGEKWGIEFSDDEIRIRLGYIRKKPALYSKFILKFFYRHSGWLHSAKQIYQEVCKLIDEENRHRERMALDTALVKQTKKVEYDKIKKPCIGTVYSFLHTLHKNGLVKVTKESGDLPYPVLYFQPTDTLVSYVARELL